MLKSNYYAFLSFFTHVFYTSAAIVGLESTSYKVTEDVGAVQVCIIVYRGLVYCPTGDVPCPVDFVFDVSLSASNSTITGDDYHYISLLKFMSNLLIEFPACDKRICVDVSIVDDEIVENDKSLEVALERPPGLDSAIILGPADGVVEITENDGRYDDHMVAAEVCGVYQVITYIHNCAFQSHCQFYE